MRYIVPGSRPEPPPPLRANSYRPPAGSLPQATPPALRQPKQARDQEPLFAVSRAHHGDTWSRADTLHAAVRRLIDERERIPAIRQKLRQLANAHHSGFKSGG